MATAFPIDGKKRLLLEARLVDGSSIVENGVITSPPAHLTQDRSTPNGSGVSTQLDAKTAEKDVIHLDSNSSGSGSRSSSRVSVKENRRKENFLLDRDMSGKRPLEFEGVDSLDGIREDNKATKSKRSERSLESPEPEKIANNGGTLFNF